MNLIEYINTTFQESADAQLQALEKSAPAIADAAELVVGRLLVIDLQQCGQRVPGGDLPLPKLSCVFHRAGRLS